MNLSANGIRDFYIRLLVDVDDDVIDDVGDVGDGVVMLNRLC